jgi:CheY-like chemotaxis protein
MAASHNGTLSPPSYCELVALRLLIVDDNPGFLCAARALLEQEGIWVVGVAFSGAEAVQRAAELRPDVTLLDIELGDDSGFSVARQLVDDPLLQPGQIILISAYSEVEFLDLIEESPAVGFLRKPALSANAIWKLLSAADERRRRPGKTPKS